MLVRIDGTKGETEDDRALRAKLDTRYVLEGSIRKGGSVIRVSAQLVDTETGAQLWSTRLLKHLPADTGMAFVLVQHLDPVHESALANLLSKATKMPVR